MAYYHKYSYELKVQVLKKYLEEGESVPDLCAAYGMSRRSMNDWIRLYQTFGFDGLRSGSRGTKYSAEIKKQAVRDYLTQEIPLSEILMKYEIRSDTQLKNWAAKYLGIEPAKSGTPALSVNEMDLSRARKASIYQRIREKHAKNQGSVSQLCREANVSRAGYYKWLNRKMSASELKNRHIADLIIKIHRDSPDKGYRRIRDELERYHNIKVNDKRVLRLCRILNIKSGIIGASDNHIYRKKQYRYVAENLLKRDFRAEKPNEKWVTDVTEFKYFVNGEKRKVYLSAILDLYDRRIVAYSIRNYNDNELVYDTLDKALEKEPDAHPLLHSDRGVQYTSYDYRQKLLDAEITQSMSRQGKCVDNGPMEGFWGIIKRERYYGRTFKRRSAIVRMVHNYIEYYNNKRLQRNLGVCTPMEKHNHYKKAA